MEEKYYENIIQGLKLIAEKYNFPYVLDSSNSKISLTPNNNTWITYDNNKKAFNVYGDSNELQLQLIDCYKMDLTRVMELVMI